MNLNITGLHKKHLPSLGTQIDLKRRLKMVVVGDDQVGKTCLLQGYTTNTFPKDHEITVIENFTTNINVDGEILTLDLWDTAGQSSYDEMRPLSYNDTDLFLICFSIDNRKSYNNVTKKWITEINKTMEKNKTIPHPPIILVGTKTDLRNDLMTKYLQFQSENEKKNVKNNNNKNNKNNNNNNSKNKNNSQKNTKSTKNGKNDKNSKNATNSKAKTANTKNGNSNNNNNNNNNNKQTKTVKKTNEKNTSSKQKSGNKKKNDTTAIAGSGNNTANKNNSKNKKKNDNNNNITKNNNNTKKKVATTSNKNDSKKNNKKQNNTKNNNSNKKSNLKYRGNGNTNAKTKGKGKTNNNNNNNKSNKKGNNNKKKVKKTVKKPLEMVDGIRLANKNSKLHVKYYVECSALTKEGLTDAFDKAVDIALNPNVQLKLDPQYASIGINDDSGDDNDNDDDDDDDNDNDDLAGHSNKIASRSPSASSERRMWNENDDDNDDSNENDKESNGGCNCYIL